MKILHIYDETNTSDAVVPLSRGQYSIILNLSKYLVEKGHRVTVLFRREEEGDEYMDDIRIILLKSRKIAKYSYIEIKKPLGPLHMILDYFLVWIKINKFLKKNEFDVIHVHTPFSPSILITLNRKLRKKMVYTAHIGEEKKRFNLDKKAPLLLKLFSPDLYLMKRVRRSVVLNNPLREKLIEKGIKEENIVTIPNGVDIKKFGGIFLDEYFKEKYEIENPTILFVGTTTPRKGVEYLVKAAKILKDEKCKAKFIIAGDTSLDQEYLRSLSEYVEVYNLPVKITGFIPYEDLRKLYVACDIFVAPSLEEGFGMVLTEAMASGKPLIGTRVGGIPMQIRDGWNGFLVEPVNEKQLAEKIKYLVENEEERIKMGRNSRKIAEDEFDWSKIAGKYLEVYEEVAR